MRIRSVAFLIRIHLWELARAKCAAELHFVDDRLFDNVELFFLELFLRQKQNGSVINVQPGPMHVQFGPILAQS